MKRKQGILSVVLTGIMVLSIFAINKFNIPASAETESVKSVSTTADAQVISAPIEYIGEKTITANGNASISVSPDMAYISIGVVSEDKKLTNAQNTANKNMNTVIESLKKLGIVDKEIKTTNYSVNPKYDWNNTTGESKIVGYTVNNTVEVTVNNLDELGTIIDTVTASGSNQVGSIAFALKDESTVYNQALQAAVKNAKTKANAMAKGLEVTIVSPVKITETGYSNPIIYNTGLYAETASFDKTSISSGQLNVTASVSVEFSFK